MKKAYTRKEEEPENDPVHASSGGDLLSAFLKYDNLNTNKNSGSKIRMAFFTTAVTGLKTVVTAIGAGVGVWGVINLLEGYGNDNPGAKSQGIKHFIPK